MNVLLYDGPGIANLQRPLSLLLKASLQSNFDVIPVGKRSNGGAGSVFSSQPWQQSTRLVVIPGGRDLLFLKELSCLESEGKGGGGGGGQAGRIISPPTNTSSSPSLNGWQRIKEWVTKDGGSYLGICGGAYFASDSLAFEVDRPDYKVEGERPLKFFPGQAKGSIQEGFVYGTEKGASAMKLTLSPALAALVKAPSVFAYVNGGPYFKDAKNFQNIVEILATYDNGEAAIVKCKVGKGFAILTGPHLEVDSHFLQESLILQNSENHDIIKAIIPAIESSDAERRSLFLTLLEMLGLPVTREIDLDNFEKKFPIWIHSSSSNDLFFLKDRFLNFAGGIKNENQTLIQDNANNFIVTDNASLEISTPNDQDLAVKFYDSSLPSFPQFSIQKYFDCLTAHSKQHPPQLGNVLLYSQRTGSTQTTIEKNSSFSSILPSGSIFVASQQTAGRGRGKNSWISQKGCLMFSLRLAHTQVSSLIFLQYLFGLAVVKGVKAMDGCSQIPIHLKWPNDIYILSPTDGLKKIGGILVTSEYTNQSFNVTIGCGLNVLNQKPTVCLQDFADSLLNIEEVLAGIMVEFQILYTQILYQPPEDVFASFRESYYSFWLHTNQRVQVKRDDGTLSSALIRGLDATGFLKAKTDGGEILLLQPDGNSFDMTSGLITVKS